MSVFLQTLVLSRYVCVLKKGYQDTEGILSSVTTKVKGIALTNTSDLGLRIWDVADYIIPPQVSQIYRLIEVLTGLILNHLAVMVLVTVCCGRFMTCPVNVHTWSQFHSSRFHVRFKDSLIKKRADSNWAIVFWDYSDE